MSWHLFNPENGIRFVKARTPPIDHSDRAERQVTSSLTGTEIRRFYEELLAQPSITSPSGSDESGVRLEEVEEDVRTMNPGTHDEATTSQQPPLPPIPERVPSVRPLTERDVNRFLKSAAEDDIERVKHYCRRGMDIEMTDLFGWTALLCASSAGALNVVDYLLGRGVDIEKRDTKGRSAIDLARMNGCHEVVDLFEAWRLEQLATTLQRQAGLERRGHCSLCGVDYEGEEHDASMIHMINTGQLPSDGYAYGIPHSNRGYQLLKNHGWTETSGLGKLGEGRKYPVKTVLKRDLKGLGMERKPARVTHFHAHDERAVKSGQRRMKMKYVVAKKQSREKRLEIKYRRMLNE